MALSAERLAFVGITASECAVAAGVGKEACPDALYKVKTGEEKRSKEDTFATLHGKTMEPRAIEWYSAQTGNIVDKSPFRVHSKYDWIGATPDGIVNNPKFNGANTSEPLLLEVKCPFLAGLNDFIPIHYMAQIQMQLEVYNVNMAHFWVYDHKTNCASLWLVYRSKLFWSWMFRKLSDFWECVIAKKPLFVTPYMFYEVDALLKNGYQFEKDAITKRYPRSSYPPRVHVIQLCDKVGVAVTSKKREREEGDDGDDGATPNEPSKEVQQ